MKGRKHPSDETPRDYFENVGKWDIESISLDDALDEYIEDRQEEISDGTIETHKSRLQIFIDILKDEGVETTDDIHPKHLAKYKRRRSRDIKKVSLEGQLQTVRVFLKHLENIYACPSGLHTHVPDIDLDPEEERRTEHLDVDPGNAILEKQRKYNYANAEHVIIELTWATAMRICDVRAIDEEDFLPEEQMIKLEHRPDTETPLKNGEASERPVGLPEPVNDAIQDYLNNPERPDVADDHGRNPLIVSEEGRMAGSTIRNIIYSLTEPCYYSGECPHDRDPEECRPALNRNHASKCPSSLSPHPVRRGAITRQREYGISKERISPRADVSPEVIEKHYEALSDEEIVESRRDEFDDEYEDLG